MEEVVSEWKGEWISVKERLPEEDEPVLSFSIDGIRVSGMRKGVGWWSNFGSDSCGCCDSYERSILYWMPLPPPPDTGDLKEKV